MASVVTHWFRHKSAFILITWIALKTNTTTLGTDSSSGLVQQRQCLKPVPIQIPECLNTFYNFTGMPNLVDQETQLDAQQQLQTFKPLIVYQCSRKLTFFLCSVYTPMCDVNTRHLIGPCRPLCEHVKARCAPVLRIFDFDWPSNLNCSRFPIKNAIGGTMCMEGPYDPEERIMTMEEREVGPDPNTLPAEFMLNNNPNEPPRSKAREVSGVSTTAPADTELKPDEQMLRNWIQQVARLQNDDVTSALMHLPPPSISVMAKSLRHCSYLKKPTFYVYINRTGRCAPLCRADILFKQDAKSWSTVWTSVVTAVCFFTTGLTLIGYTIDSTAFQVTEKPVIYIALCQIIQCVAFMISLGNGRETSTCGKDLDSGLQIRLQEGLDNSICAFVFMLQFFFSLASLIWWVLLTILWAAAHNPSRCSRYTNCWEPVTSHDSYHLSSVAQTNYLLPSRERCKIDAIQSSPDKCVTRKTAGWGDQFVKRDYSETMNGSVIRKHADLNNPPASATTFHAHSLSHPSEVTPYFVQNGRVVPSYRYLYLRENPRLYTEVTERLSVCLAREHIIVWLTASLFTVGVLVSRQVDADELIPVCGVGRQNIKAMGAFVIGPQVILVTIGTLGLLVGILSMVAESVQKRGLSLGTSAQTRSGELKTSDSSRLLRNSPVSTAVEPNNQTTDRDANGNQSTNNSQRFTHVYSMSDARFQYADGFIQRLGLFCFLYLLPAVCVVSCDLYEYMHRDEWLTDATYKPASSSEDSKMPFPPKIWKPDETVGPNPEIFMLRVFMSLVPGVTCSLWIWSGKGCKPWIRLSRKVKALCLFCQDLPSRYQNGKLVFKSRTKPTGLSFHFPPAEQQTLSSNSRIIPSPPFALSSYPYAVYQYHPNQSLRDPPDRIVQPIWSSGLDPCVVQTVVTTHSFEMQHSNATTPGYYSQAKVGSVIEPNQSDSFSEESAIPPPLPVSARPQILPHKNDVCVGLTRTNLDLQTRDKAPS